jgi:hypothetical protein
MVNGGIDSLVSSSVDDYIKFPMDQLFGDRKADPRS